MGEVRARQWWVDAAAAVALAVVMLGFKCSGQAPTVPGGPEVRVTPLERQAPDMERLCPVCSGRGRVLRVRCHFCKGFGRVRL